MENENLFNKVRELLQDANNRDAEWDSDRFWNMLESKKRKQQRRLWFSYATAAMLLFVVGYSTYHFQQQSQISVQKDVAVANISTDRNASIPNLKFSQGTTIKPLRQQHKTKYAASKRSRALTKTRKKTHSQSYQMTMGTPGSISVYAENKHEISSFVQMREAGKRERELRQLSVKLDDKDGFNNFWLTVNQQVLANKFNGDKALLHYEMPDYSD